MAKKQYLKEDGSLDFEKLDLLTEEQLYTEQQTWSEAERYQYVTRNGVMTLDEFEQALNNKIDEYVQRCNVNEL